MSPEQRMDQLRAAEAAGTDIDPVAFWRPRPTATGAIGPSCLSQWWPSPFVVDGQTYPTAEHWMMAGKARLFDDPAELAAVLTTNDPDAARTAGRKVCDFDGQRWNAARFDLVVAGNLAKFTQDAELCAFLLSTGDRALVEASPYDRIWGIGLAPTNPGVRHPSAWRGVNLLGFALMDVRDRLRTAHN